MWGGTLVLSLDGLASTPHNDFPHNERLPHMVENIFDLDSFGALDQVEYEVHAPGDKDKKIGLTLILAGTSHPDYQKHIEEEFRRILKEQEKVEKAKAEGKELPADEKTIAELREANVKLVASRVIGAKTPIKFRGEVITLSKSNSLVVLSDPKFVWMVPQIREFLEEDANFMPVSAPNS